MFRWLQAFVRRELVANVSPEMDLCLDCGKLECSEGEFRDCARRKERAAELTLGLSAPLAAKGDTSRGARVCEADAEEAGDQSTANARRP